MNTATLVIERQLTHFHGDLGDLLPSTDELISVEQPR